MSLLQEALRLVGEHNAKVEAGRKPEKERIRIEIRAAAKSGEREAKIRGPEWVGGWLKGEGFRVMRALPLHSDLWHVSWPDPKETAPTLPPVVVPPVAPAPVSPWFDPNTPWWGPPTTCKTDGAA